MVSIAPKAIAAMIMMVACFMEKRGSVQLILFIGLHRFGCVHDLLFLLFLFCFGQHSDWKMPILKPSRYMFCPFFWGNL